MGRIAARARSVTGPPPPFNRDQRAGACLGGCPGNHGGCGERSGGARRQPRCQMVARSSLLRRPTPGARSARRTSSVVAALAALAPRLVRLAHHDYPDRLLELVGESQLGLGAAVVEAAEAPGLEDGRAATLRRDEVALRDVDDEVVAHHV